MKNPKALAVFQEWIAANCIKGELMEYSETANYFLVTKQGTGFKLSSVWFKEDELSTGTNQDDAGVSVV